MTAVPRSAPKADRLDHELWLWLDEEHIQLVAAAPGRDALTLTLPEARRVAARLLQLVGSAPAPCEPPGLRVL